MKLKKWEDLPCQMQIPEVRPYYEMLEKKRFSLILKRLFDIAASAALLVVLLPFFALLSVIIKLDSPGSVFYRQERVTQYGRIFRIHKFRTMVQGADKGSQVTVNNDCRITRVGKIIRDFRIDELAQLIDVLAGDLTLVGVRPESVFYARQYTPVMLATLLLPAGVTSIASIYYKDEARLLDGAEDTDKVYIEKILPEKMYYNLKGVEQFSFTGDIKILFMTVFAVLGKEYKPDFAGASEKNEEFEHE